ncbi:PRC-barrel domain containing protein [Cellulomonas sp. NPDC089187]|uniref:PRC-barrel domain-containing protein n=1 Tax=Cellulomonas sp. NPDC089187 TaxID=3154970 RepID=UPI00343D2D8C
MLLSDLLDLPVTLDGERVGYVVDVRLVLDGPVSGTLASPRVHGLLVSPRTGTSFLGYERTDVTAPWPIARWMRWRHRGTFLAHWGDVDQVGAEGVALRSGAPRYDAALHGPTPEASHGSER